MNKPEITELLLTPNKYSRPGLPLKKITGVVVHYVGNAGSSAAANRNYFESLGKSGARYASSHYIIGLYGEIIRCVPEAEIAYASNSRNADTISIECCHPTTTGEFNPQTYEALIGILADICRRYNLNPAVDIIRHYDITKKLCPLYYVNYPSEWARLKADAAAALVQERVTIEINGRQTKISAVYEAGRYTAGVRDVLEACGFRVTWRERDRAIEITSVPNEQW